MAEFAWKRYPEAEGLVAGWLDDGRAGNAFLDRLARRMRDETSTTLADWVDHLVVAERPGVYEALEGSGYRRELDLYGPGVPVFGHEGGDFPRVAVAPGASGPAVREVALKVESAADFSRAHDIGLAIHGYALGPLRVGRIPGEATAMAVYERRGYRGFEPFGSDLARAGRMAPHAARDALAAQALWHGRRRKFDDDEAGIAATERLLDDVIDLCGGSTDLACELVFAAERDYWTGRNVAARVQKARQDRLGLGWANHDHHTFRCSRRFFPRIIAMFRRLGFALRERFHAGAQAGWGAQVLEHPVTGIVIFADLDLAPEEATQDFSRQALPDLPRPNTVGLWVGLHGESILEGGMHHLEAQFDFDRLRDDLAGLGIPMMKPFSDFPFLRQAFTKGETWPVCPRRLERLRHAGWIDDAQAATFRAEGAIGSHLENLERREGFKGFNQAAVGAILIETDPRSQATAGGGGRSG
jgi:hypothetical protein